MTAGAKIEEAMAVANVLAAPKWAGVLTENERYMIALADEVLSLRASLREKDAAIKDAIAAANDPSVMAGWDRERASIAAGNTGSGPRDWFESVIASIIEPFDRAAAALEVK